MNNAHSSNQPTELPTLPRTSYLMAADTWEKELKDGAGVPDHAINAAVTAQRRMIDALGALENVRKTRNPLDTPAAHINRAAKGYERMINAADRHYNSAVATVSSRKAELETEITRSLGLIASPDATEIRQALRSMSSEKRGAAVQQAIETKDGAILHAVFNGRELTTGITDVQRASFLRRAREMYAPDLLRLQTALDRAAQMVVGAYENLLDMAPYAAGTPEVQSEFERRTAAADEALAALNRMV